MSKVTPTVGMGASGTYHSDLTPYTIISVTKSGKTIKLQRDQAAVIKGSAQDGSAEYDITPDPEGVIITARLTKDGWRTSDGYRVFLGYRRKYYDPSF